MTPKVLSKPKQKDQMPKPVVELSFGHSQLFNESKYAAVRQVGVGGIVPTSSVLFIGEWLTAPRWGVLAVFNLPLTTQQTVNEQGEVFQGAGRTLGCPRRTLLTPAF